MSRIDKLEQEKQQLVEQLVQQLLNTSNSLQTTTAIHQIAVTILRSRPLCRRFNGLPLTGIYQEIYLQAKEKLVEHLTHLYRIVCSDKAAAKSGLEQLRSTRLYELQRQIFKESLNDEQLKQMGLTAQGYALGSELRSYALTELVRAIEFSGRLCKPHIKKFSSDLYYKLYEEALTETLCYVCLNIDLYDPNRGDRKFMNWVNFKLDKTILKCYEKYHRYAKFEIPSSPNIDLIVQPTSAPDLTQILREYIVQDPKGIFKATHIRNRPEANFTNIALAKFSGQSWEQISQQLDIPVATLSSFYNRWCSRFKPLLNTALKQYF